nr:unnamed protein product [Callosobruchus chinensis]
MTAVRGRNVEDPGPPSRRNSWRY